MENPKIRFKGFTKDWEQRKFGEITELKSASRVHKDEWTSNGVPFYRSSDVMTAINGTENEKAFISEELYEKLSKVSGKLEEGDILVTGGGSVGNPYIVPDNKPLYTKDADLLWIKNKGKFHPYFLYEFFFSPTFRNYLGSISHVGTIAHYTITQLSDTPISLPSFEEQKEVGEYFQSLDHLITLHQRKCEQTKNLKKYMLQKMFPKNGAKVPEIRFDGFTYDWEQRKLVDIASSFEYGLNAAAKEYDEENKYIRITDIDDNTHEFLTDNLTSPDIDLTGADNYKLTKGDILFARTGASVGKSYIYRISDGLVYYAGFLIRARIKEEYDEEFVFQNTLTDRYNKYIAVTSQRSGQPGVNAQEYSEFEIKVPKKEEQTKIGIYFRNLDHLITLHQRKCDELKKMKKYMLQNMFI